MRKCKIAVIAGVFLSVFSLPLFASDWSLSYRNLTQLKKSRSRDFQVPVNQYVSLGVSEGPRNFSFQTDFRSFVNAGATPEEDAFDLYQAAFHVEPVETFSIDGGRQWLIDGFDGIIVDGLKLGLAPESGHIGGDIYAGIPRYIEEGDFHNITEGLLVGANLNLLNIKDTAAQLSLRWRKLDATRNNYKQNDTIYVGLASSHQFSDLKASPNLYGDVEYNIAGATLDVGTLGLSLYPYWRVALTFEGNYFDVARNSNETTIFENYFTDELIQGRQAAQIKLTKNFHFFEDFSYLHYGVAGLGSRNGYMIGAGLDYYLELAKMSSSTEYYYRKSFGGNVHGGIVELVNKYVEKVVADVSFDVSKYSKITNQKDTALSLVGSIGYLFTKKAFLSIGGEYNHNNWFDNEGRLTVNFEMGLDKIGYTPEKRSKKLNRRFHEI